MRMYEIRFWISYLEVLITIKQHQCKIESFHRNAIYISWKVGKRLSMRTANF